MQSAFLVFRGFPPPASRPYIVAFVDRSGTRGATDAAETDVVETVKGNFILFDVFPYLTFGPVGKGVNLEDVELRV
jgi:hypothetical protein